MANTRELRRRIRSVKNTSQITKAMEMVAATKMRRAQNQALAGRPYVETLKITLAKVLTSLDKLTHILFSKNDAQRAAVLVLSTDKSLCGSLNTSLFRVLLGLEEDIDVKVENIDFYTLGRKGREFVAKTGRQLSGDFENHEVVNYSKAVFTRKFFQKLFMETKVQSVYILYPHFVSTLRQEPRLIKILPVEHPRETAESILTEFEMEEEFIFEPNKAQLLDYLLTHYLDTAVYQTLLETKASEHSARMIAMKNATDNADELTDDLTLTYNQVRQDAITSELSEITTASLALE